MFLEEWLSIPPVDSQRLVESLLRCMLFWWFVMGKHLTKTLYFGFSFNLSSVFIATVIKIK